MKEITLNLLGIAALKRKQQKIRFILVFIYMGVCIFSIFALYSLYSTNLFISEVYNKEVAKIHSEILSLNPKVKKLDMMYTSAMNLKKRSEVYYQKIHLPDRWAGKMGDIANAIPPNIKLDQIIVNTHPSKGQEMIRLDGFSVIDKANQDVNQLNEFRDTLENMTAFMEDFSRVEVIRSRIGQKNDDPVMIFTMGVF